MKGSEADTKLVEDEYLYKLCELITQHGDKTRVVNILQTVASSCVSSGFTVYNQRICAIVGNLYFEK